MNIFSKQFLKNKIIQRGANFFIVGAPKCGTSSMYNYLKAHPDIFMCPIKEVHFFATDVPFRRDPFRDTIKTKKDYLSLFSKARKDQKIGVVNVWDLYSKIAHEKIKRFSPSAKIIIMLRNPVDMLYSFHSGLVWGGRESIKDFGKALESEQDRKKGKHIPPRIKPGQEGLLFYREIVKYTEQVKRYFNTFGKEGVHVIIFDDLKQDTAEVYRQVLRFLGVDEDFQPEFRVVNPNKQPKYKILRNFLHTPPQFLVQLVVKILPRKLLFKLLKFIGFLIKHSTGRVVKRTPMDPELRKKLRQEFKSEIQQLEKLLGKDLSRWYAH